MIPVHHLERIRLPVQVGHGKIGHTGKHRQLCCFPLRSAGQAADVQQAILPKIHFISGIFDPQLRAALTDDEPIPLLQGHPLKRIIL
ncbi:hypothetical protein D3C74_284810 [compost metagenome]